MAEDTRNDDITDGIGDYHVVLLVEQELGEMDAAQVRALHDEIEDRVVYHVLIPLEDAAARIEASMGSLSAGEMLASPAMTMRDVDLDAVHRAVESDGQAIDLMRHRELVLGGDHLATVSLVPEAKAFDRLDCSGMLSGSDPARSELQLPPDVIKMQRERCGICWEVVLHDFGGDGVDDRAEALRRRRTSPATRSSSSRGRASTGRGCAPSSRPPATATSPRSSRRANTASAAG